MRQLSQRKDLWHFWDHTGAEEPPLLQFRNKKKERKTQDNSSLTGVELCRW